jgi:hypothetical protein
VAETNALLKRHTGNCIEGSNPSVSATRCYANSLIYPQMPVKIGLKMKDADGNLIWRESLILGQPSARAISSTIGSALASFAIPTRTSRS